MATTKMTAKAKVDQKVPPGALISARIEFAGNGGCSVSYDHAPAKSEGKGDMYPRYEPRRPDVFASIEEACHAITQAAGGNSELEEYAEDKGKEKAA